MTGEEKEDGLRAWTGNRPDSAEDGKADNALDISDQVIM